MNTLKNIVLLGAGYVAGRMSKKTGPGIGAVWSPKTANQVKKLDHQFSLFLKKRNINPYSKEASDQWREAGFQNRFKKIFNK